MIDKLIGLGKKYFQHARVFIRTGLTNKAIFESIGKFELIIKKSILKSNIRAIRSIVEQADKFKYIRKDRMPTDRFFSLADRRMDFDRMSKFNVKVFNKKTGKDEIRSVYIWHDEIQEWDDKIQKSTRGILETEAKRIVEEEYEKISPDLIIKDVPVELDYGMRRNVKYNPAR